MVRELSLELQKKSRDELNEDSSKIKEYLSHIREWMEKYHLKVRGIVDDQWLLSFLRGCKFDLSKTKEKIANYYTAKALFPHITTYEDPFNPRIQKILEANIVSILPYPENSIAPRVIFTRYDNFDYNTMDFDDVLLVCFMILTILMIEDDVFLISGLTSICDIKHLPVRCMFKFTPNYLKAIQFSIFKAFPLRLKNLCVFNMNYFSVILYKLFTSFLPKKISDRFFMINKTNYDTMYKCVPKKHLPEEYGGENGTLEYSGKYWKKKIESYSDWFKEEYLYYNNK